MGNCPLKSKDEPFAIAMTPLTSGYLKYMKWYAEKAM